VFIPVILQVEGLLAALLGPSVDSPQRGRCKQRSNLLPADLLLAPVTQLPPTYISKFIGFLLAIANF